MARFLHTSDWQLGLKLAYLPGDAGALQREARFETLDAIVAAARDHRAEFVLVAGDVFDDNGVSDRTVRQMLSRLAPLAPIPIYLLPGNHDSLTPDSVYLRDVFKAEAGPHIHVLATREPVDVAETAVTLWPCPLTQRHEVIDPTEHLQPVEDHSRIHVIVAHGSLDILPDAEAAPNRIDRRVMQRTGMDYLALGDWHGLRRIDERIAYPGTHEQTRFSETDTGYILIVDIPEPGRSVRVEPVRVAHTVWQRHETSVHESADVDALAHWYEQIPDPSRTLIELTLQGSIDVPTRQKLDALLARSNDLLRWQRVKDDGLYLHASDEDLDAIATGGYLRVALDRLRECATAPPNADDDTDEARQARDALQLLFRLAARGGSIA